MPGQWDKLPEARDFRDWLRASILALNTTPARLGCEAGLSINALGVFLRKDDASIGLDTAAKVEAHVLASAAEQGIALPVRGGAR